MDSAAIAESKVEEWQIKSAETQKSHAQLTEKYARLEEDYVATTAQMNQAKLTATEAANRAAIEDTERPEWQIKSAETKKSQAQLTEKYARLEEAHDSMTVQLNQLKVITSEAVDRAVIAENEVEEWQIKSAETQKSHAQLTEKYARLEEAYVSTTAQMDQAKLTATEAANRAAIEHSERS
jgi:hypothetical protein